MIFQVSADDPNGYIYIYNFVALLRGNVRARVVVTLPLSGAHKLSCSTIAADQLPKVFGPNAVTIFVFLGCGVVYRS